MNKDLVESSRYLYVLQAYCQQGVIPDRKKVEAVEQPWIHLDDALMDYLYELMADSHYQAQVRNSRIRGKLFYTEVGKFIVDNIHYLKFQNMRSWTEQNKMKKVLEWGEAKRRDRETWMELLHEIDRIHHDDGFDKDFFIRLFSQEKDNELEGAANLLNWELLVRDWRESLNHGHRRIVENHIKARKAGFETNLRLLMDQMTQHIREKNISEAEASQAFDQMEGTWTETEFERKLREIRLQDRYPEIGEIVSRMGRIEDASGRERLTVAAGYSMKIEHSSGSDIEGVTIGNDLNALLPAELAQYGDELLGDAFIYKFLTKGLQTLRYKSEITKPSRKLGFVHATRKGPMIVCIDTSASMYGMPERIESSLISLLEDSAEKLQRDCFLIDFSVSVHPVDLLEQLHQQRLQKIGLSDRNKRMSVQERNRKEGLPFIGGGTSAKLMLDTMMELLDNDGKAYINADVLWITDFLIPMPEQTRYFKKWEEYKKTGTKFYGLRIISSDEKHENEWEHLFHKIYTIRYRQIRRY